MKKVFIALFIASLTIFSGVFSAKAWAAVPPIGNYLVLNGGYAKLETLNTGSSSGFSFEAWINPNTVTGRQIILSIGDKTQDDFSYEIGLNGGSFFTHYFYGGNGNSQRLVNAGQVQKNIWNHVAVSISGSSTVLFVNGQVVYSALGVDSLKTLSGNIILGASYSESISAGNNFKGLIDELRVSTVSRNISGLWNNGVYESSLNPDSDTLFLWHFDQTRGETKVIDSSSNELNTRLIGGDSLIHFFGVLPSPTPFTYKLRVLPTLDLHRVRFIGPPVTVSITPTPSNYFPSPSNIPGIRDWIGRERNSR